MNKILSLLPLNLEDYPEYVELHLAVVPRTRELEAEANELITENFRENLLWRFIINVHKWGGLLEYTENNLSMVLANAQPDIFIFAVQSLDSSPPDIEKALGLLMYINGLGVSYGSKHLRFLCPALCPVLDSVITRKFNYPTSDKPFDTEGYKLYQSDVMQVVEKLEENEIPNPMERPDDRWNAADVDMAIFAYFQHKAQKTGWVK